MPIEAFAIGGACVVMFGLIAWGRALSGEANEDRQPPGHHPNPPEDWYDRSDSLKTPVKQQF